MNLALDAQTVVPVLSVICAEASEEDIHSSVGSHNSKLDPIFQFNAQSPFPTFQRLPETYNSALDSNNKANKLYLVLAPGTNRPFGYNLCSMSMSVRGGCSTELKIATNSSTLRSNCAFHDMSYNKPVNITENITQDWTNIGIKWANAVALANPTDGSDTNAAMPGMLANFAPRAPSVDPTRPSLVEALAVLAASTLLDSMYSASFDGSWIYNVTSLAAPVQQPFQARMDIPAHISGPSAPWQNIFLLVLAAVFLLNVAFFYYLLLISVIRPYRSRLGYAPPHRASDSGGLQRDCTNLSELFQIALNSPQPARGTPASLSRTAGARLQDVKWHIRNREAGGESSGLDGGTEGLRVAFDEDEDFLWSSPTQGHFDSPLMEIPDVPKQRFKVHSPYEVDHAESR